MRLTPGSFKGLRFAGTLVLLTAGIALGLVYWNSVNARRQYLTSRNFRLLTVLAAQVQRTIDVQVRIIQGFVPDTSKKRAKVQRARSLAEALQSLPTLQQAELLTAPQARTIATHASARYRMESETGRTWLRIAVFPDKTAGPPMLDIRLRAAQILAAVFSPKLAQGAFDTLILATRDGRVVYATGRRGEEVQWSELGTLLRRHKTANGPAFADLARTTSVDDVVIAGVDYKMFMQPCCGATLDENGRPAADTANGAMIVAGLVETATLDSSARTISPTAVLIGMVFVLLAVVSWPFLKLALLGDRQRIAVMDVVQLGTCAVLGLALATAVALTTVAYLRLSADVDEQLEGLAAALNAHLTTELTQAHAQLTCMERLLIDHEPDLSARAGGPLRCGPENTPDAPPYPFFDTFALIDNDGQQVVKASPGTRVSGALSVADRQYFEAVRGGRAWRGIPVCPRGCFLEAVRSWTSGEQRAVLSIPTGRVERPVAALSIPLRSMINVVLPVGFQFAIIDEHHKVVFHSDPERNGYEDFVTEADRNLRLRAVVAARSAGALNLNYWGRAHRAYVQPSVVPHWSIVTLNDKESTRGLNVESTALTVLFLVVYMALWVAAVVAVLRIGAAWLWPDPHRRLHYWLLAGTYVFFLAVFAVLGRRGDTSALLWAGFVLPTTGWLIAAAVLSGWRWPRPDRRRPSSALAAYTTMGGLLLVLSGVLPAIAFVARAHDINLESFVKHRQLELARTLGSRPRALPCDRDSRAAGSWAAGIDEYFEFFYRTRLACASSRGVQRDAHAGHDSDMLVAFLEDYMPYYGEFSIGMRELLHARAGDGSWASRRSGAGELELTIGTLTARSVVPSVGAAVVPQAPDAATHADLHHGRAMSFVPAFLAAAGLAVSLLVRAMVRFALGHVFLAEVCQSLVSRRRRRAAPEPPEIVPGLAANRGGWRRVVRPAADAVLVNEGSANPFLKRVCDDIRASRLYAEGALTRDHILDEIEERTASYYARVWSTCSNDEKIVLGHVAHQGLANPSSRRVVRRLLVRGLLFKDPSLRLMNDTFTRFVLSATCRSDVKSLEGEAEPSTWDRLRLPLALGAASAGAFLFVTQREVFDSTLTTVAGVTAAVPTVIRLAQLVLDRRADAGQEARET
jgi:hypothetical protein